MRLLLPTVLLLMNCASAAPRPIERVIERVRAPAPELPSMCADAKRPLSLAPRDARRTLVVFSSDWCDACDRLLGALSGEARRLEREGVAVVHVVTDTQGSCLEAARVARRAPFAYAAIDGGPQATWAVRSTPTVWILGKGGTEARVYVEGEVPLAELWGLLGL